MITHALAGDVGSDGKGGIGGKYAENGRDSTLRIVFTGSIHLQTETVREIIRNNENVGRQERGEHGIDGQNCRPPTVEPQPFDSYDPAITLNHYKLYAREYLANDIQISDFDEFLQYLSDDANLTEIYDTNALIKDFESIESHYFRLRDEISFHPYYESLSMRIANFSRLLSADQSDERQAINYLYTALKSRQFAVGTHANYVAVVHILEFMKTVKKRMERFQQAQKTKYIIEYRDNFKDALNKKIADATNLIDQSVLPPINDAIYDTNRRIKELLDELTTAKKLAEIQHQRSKENRNALQTKLILHALLSPLKLITPALSLLGPPGMIAGSAIGSGLAIADTVIDNTLTMKKVTVPTILVKREVERITKQAKKNFQNLELQLNDLFDILKTETTDELEPIKNEIDNLKANIFMVLNVIEIPNPNQVKQLQTSREQLLKLVQDTTKVFVDRNSTDAIDIETIAVLGRVKSVLTVGQAGIEIYGQIREDNQKLLEADVIVSQIEQQLKVIQLHEMNIYSIMLPELRLIEQSVQFATKETADKSHVHLDISRWSIQNTLKDVKNLFNQMSKGFLVSRDLERCIEKISDGITTVIDVYDRIDSYTEKAQLATLIGDIGIGKGDIESVGLQRDVQQMEVIINANLAMEKYEMAMIGLKQHKFPFAKHFLNEFDLPRNTSVTDANFMNILVERVNDLVLQIEESGAIIQDFHSYLHDNYPFFWTESFYKWDYANHKDDFINLLNGDVVIFSADINAGVEKSAVKFKEIWIEFLLKNSADQGLFNQELSEFEIQLEMVGNSYYRCDNRIYYISLENPLLLTFEWKNGELFNPNRAYDLLKTSDYFLSPYVTWKISLRPKNSNNNAFRRLRPFANKISKILLHGYGQYLKNEEKFIQTICNEKLDSFYRLDSIKRFL